MPEVGDVGGYTGGPSHPNVTSTSQVPPARRVRAQSRGGLETLS